MRVRRREASSRCLFTSCSAGVRGVGRFGTGAAAEEGQGYPLQGQPSLLDALSYAAMLITIFLCAEAVRGKEGGGAEGERNGSNGNSEQRKSEHLQAAGLDVFPVRILPILHIGEKMGKRPALE
ncbi:hypothetical protein AOLI_G00083950 [Acnodon oligacanthus]